MTTLDDLQTPALLIRIDRVRSNIERMLQLLEGNVERWRPHIKTSKIPEVLDLLLEAGVRRFKCATTREAQVMLARAGAEPIDLLIAFAHHGPNLARIATLAEEFPQHRIGMLSEDPAHAAEVRKQAHGVQLFVDLDPGYHRTGVPLRDRERIYGIIDAAGLNLVGLHYYDGHILATDPAERAVLCDGIYQDLLELADELGRDELELITSGTPTFGHALAFAGFQGRNHTVSPGTIVYSDLRTEEALGIEGFQRAAHVLSRVISSPFPDRVTCDAGSKALDAAAGDPCAEVEGWDNLLALRPSEEHLPMTVSKLPGPAIGTLLELAPRHVCPTVNLADEAVLMMGDRVLDVVPVAARGHETLRHGGR